MYHLLENHISNWSRKKVELDNFKENTTKLIICKCNVRDSQISSGFIMCVDTHPSFYILVFVFKDKDSINCAI